MQALARSLAFHLLVPYAVQLAAAYLMVSSLFLFEHVEIVWLLVCYPALVAGALIGIPFGAVHILQAVCFARDWPGARKPILVGLLNPSFAVITIAALLYFAPKIILP